MRRIGNKRLIAIIALIILTFLLTDWVLGYLYENSHEKPINLEENVIVTIKDNKGIVREDDTLIEKGEVAHIEVTLPSTKRDECYCLEMSTRHCVVESYYNDKLIYSKGSEYAREDKMIGAIYPCIEIPDDAWGSAIIIRLTSYENIPININKNIMLYKLADNKQYFKSNFFLGFYHYIIIIFISFVVAILMLINYRRNNIIKQVMWISIFCFLISLWGITYFGYYNIVFGNSWMFAQVEYMAVYYAAIPLGIYAIYKEQDETILRKILTVITSTITIFAAVATILNFNTRIHLVYLLPYMQILILIGAAAFLYQMIKNIKTTNLRTKIFNSGFLVLIITSLGDIVKTNLEKWGFIEESSIITLTSIGVIIFVIATIIFVLLILFDYLEYDIERRTLLSMAYEDPMTGLANRAACDKRLTWLEISSAKDYALIYMDLNNLKYVNDNYGHASGDEYIRRFTEVLESVFPEKCFCGRLGGDEFLVILRDEMVNKSEMYIKEIQRKIEELNEKSGYDFEIAVAIGVGKKRDNLSDGVMDVLKKADERMYLHKEEARKDN